MQHQLSSSSSSFQSPSHVSPHVQPPHSASPAHGTLAKLTETLRELPKRGRISHPGTSHTATDSDGGDEKEDLSTDTENDKRRDSAAWRRDKKKRRRKAEIYVSLLLAYQMDMLRSTSATQITRHISSLISRQTFILKLARAMMMFGSPTHRLQAQMQSTARVLEISLSCMYLPDVMLIAFDDDVTSTSSVKLIRQSSALDLGKVQDAYKVYWRVGVPCQGRQVKGLKRLIQVIHDDISVTEASAALDELMLSKPLYSPWQLIFFGGMASASICSVSFNGSVIDSLVSFPLGALLVAVQMLSVRNELYSNVFECVASSHRFLIHAN